MYQESEIVVLLMAVFLTPLIYVVFRTVRLPGKRWFVFAYGAMMVAYVCTVIEGYLAPDVFNMLEHLGYAISGAGFVGGAWSMLVAARRRRPS